MRYGSVCSGIEAATQAWHGLGWTPAFFSDIEKFPVAVLQHHYPDVPCHGDFTTIKDDEYGPIDLLVGGTPCQSFSIAGLRGGMDDDRGNLALEFIRLAQRKRPQWLVWENVPGVLSSNGGRDFGSFLGALAEIGYGFAYRVLDAQFFGVPQRRRRVFVVGYLGDWRRAAAVLFERESLSGNPAPSREEGAEVAPTVTTGPPFSRTGQAAEVTAMIPVGKHRVRRMTVTECERLQGFPDSYTQIPWRGKEPENCPDGPRYKALGNSMAVPVMSWIGERIQAVENLQ
jgi:DNA (cytosine-5)-methyltransferase 1